MGWILDNSLSLTHTHTHTQALFLTYSFNLSFSLPSNLTLFTVFFFSVSGTLSFYLSVSFCFLLVHSLTLFLYLSYTQTFFFYFSLSLAQFPTLLYLFSSLCLTSSLLHSANSIQTNFFIIRYSGTCHSLRQQFLIFRLKLSELDFEDIQNVDGLCLVSLLA